MDPSISQVADDYVDRFVEADPVRASRLMGLARDATRLTDYSIEGHAERAALYRRTLDEVAAAVPTDEAERLGKAYLEDVCSSALALLDAGEPQRFVSAISGPPASIRMSFDVMARETDEDWERVAARLDDVARALAGYRETLGVGAASGRVASMRLVGAVAEQCETWAASWFDEFARSYGEGRLRDRVIRAATSAASAYGELASWLRTEYALSATTVDGVGPERYALHAQGVLGAELDLDEAYAWAEDELARLEAEKRVESARVKPGAGVEEAQAYLQSGGGETVEGVERFRDRLQEILDEAVSGLHGVEFDIVEPLRRCVVGIPPAGTALAPYYSPPSEDLTESGTTWFPTQGESRFPMWEHYSTIYHEAVPGHHLQFGLLRVLPLVRAQRVGGNTAHCEGWALYAERLMDELGWFERPETRLGFLCAQAFRAARVVVDIGLHLGRGGWDFERAVDRIALAAGRDSAFAESEVLRYLSWPVQATAYKLGERVWLAGRQAAMDSAGSSFDRKTWHSSALALGPLGLARLETELAALAH